MQLSVDLFIQRVSIEAIIIIIKRTRTRPIVHATYFSYCNIALSNRRNPI